MRRGFTRLREAQDLARRAAAVGTGGISSDDPEAVTLLAEKVADLEAQRDRAKAINAAYRKAKGAKGWSQGLNLTQQEAVAIASTARAQPFYNGVPYPPYCLTNLGARIRDAQKRAQELGHLAERAAEGPTEATVNGVVIVADPVENRVTLKYPRRLTTAEYKQVRSFSFVSGCLRQSRMDAVRLEIGTITGASLPHRPSPVLAKFNWPWWIRTTINGSKVRCPAVGRRAIASIT